jgi:hypothetical protein
MIGHWKNGVPSAGLFAGAFAWIISTQLNYSLVAFVCATRMSWAIPLIALVLIAVSLAGGFLSWRAWTTPTTEPSPGSSIAEPRRFLAGVGMSSAALFALVIAALVSAALLPLGCDR